MDTKRMISVGIDIGTSTTQLVFSYLMVGNQAGYFQIPSVSIVDKEIFYNSEIYRTPLIDRSLIDGKKLVQILKKEYEKAGVKPEQVETGAVIITGESARKENAKLILEEMSSFAGDFVVSTAGPDLESVIAGKGSGAQRESKEKGSVVVNLDIGGGTTNIVAFSDGEVCGRGCLDIGGRQIIFDEAHRITYLSPSAEKIAAFYHIPVKVGMLADEAAIKEICEHMSELLDQALGASERTPLLEQVWTAGAEHLEIHGGRPIRTVAFSGGVADCIYRENTDAYRYLDIGVFLGNAVRTGKLARTFQVFDSEHTIRATVIGAGLYTTSISGSTITFDDGLFPLKNVPVYKLTAGEEASLWQGDETVLQKRLQWFLEQSDSPFAALALEGQVNPGYRQVKMLAETLNRGLEGVLWREDPMILILREDMAKALGQLLKRLVRPDRRVIVIDEIEVESNSFVDLGFPLMNGLVVPVVIKTLIFG